MNIRKKQIIAIILVIALVIAAAWVCWFGGFRIFGTLSELDDDGIHTFLALNVIGSETLGDRTESAQIVRNWLREFEENPSVSLNYGADTPAGRVLSAALRYYYGLGPVTAYPPEVRTGWLFSVNDDGSVTEPGAVQIYAQYHPGIPWNSYFPPVDDTITFRVTAEAGSLALTSAAAVGEATEYTVDNQTEVVWLPWDLVAGKPWEGTETFVEVTMFRNGVAEYRVRLRIFWTDSQEMASDASGYTGEVTETVKLTSE